MNEYLSLITWSVDPVAFSIGPLSVRWYGILLAAGFYLSYLTLCKIFKYEAISQKTIDKMSIWLIVWTIIGLRLGHFLFYEPEYFITAPLQIILPFDSNWNFIGFQGLASHGAVIALIGYVIYFSLKNKMNVLWLLDRIALIVLIAASFVRIGNLMNHEIVGEITTMPWAFNFTKGGFGVEGTYRHPSQLYESIVYLLTYISLLFYYFKIAKGNIPAGRVFGTMLIVVFSARFIIEFFKEIQVAKESSMLLDIGQWLSIPFILLGLSLLIYSIIKKNNIPHYVEPK